MSEDSKSKKGGLFMWMAIALLITNIITIVFLVRSHNENVELVTANTDLDVENAELEAELTEMLAQYDSVSTDNAEMQAQIAEQKAQIEKLLDEAKKHKDDAWTIYKLKKEAATLRGIMKSYLVTIDSLNTANQALMVQKEEVQQQLQKKEEDYTELESKADDLQEKVKLGSKLRVMDLFSGGQRVKNSTVHRETDRAKRTDKIKTCFTIDRNEVTKPGNKTIYLRIIDPKGNVLAFDQTQEYMFTYDGKEGLYSRKEEILYENEEIDMCLYWDVTTELEPGEYIVETYAEDYLMGTTTFELK